VKLGELRLERGDSGEDGRHPCTHLAPDYEDAPGIRERGRSIAVKSLVFLRRVFDPASVRHDRVRNSRPGAHALCDYRHEHDMICVNRRDLMPGHNAQHDFYVAVDIELDLLIAQLDHRDDTVEFLVLVFHEYRERRAYLGLMENAFTGEGSIALELRLDFTGQRMLECFGDCRVSVGMVLLADEMHRLAASGERGDHRASPEIAA